MKSAQNLIHHLFRSPKFYQQKCLARLFHLLPPKFKQMVHYAFIKNDTLYFVLSHPGFKLEIDYNKKLINELLKMLQTKSVFCKNIDIRQIKSFYKFIPQPTTQKPKMLLRYKEQAKGEFEIRTKEEHLRVLLEQIRQRIKQNAQE